MYLTTVQSILVVWVSQPRDVMWMLKSPITICGMFLVIGVKTVCFCGFYTEYTTTPCITIVIISTVSFTLCKCSLPSGGLG